MNKEDLLGKFGSEPFSFNPLNERERSQAWSPDNQDYFIFSDAHGKAEHIGKLGVMYGSNGMGGGGWTYVFVWMSGGWCPVWTDDYNPKSWLESGVRKLVS